MRARLRPFGLNAINACDNNISRNKYRDVNPFWYITSGA